MIIWYINTLETDSRWKKNSIIAYFTILHDTWRTESSLSLVKP